MNRLIKITSWVFYHAYGTGTCLSIRGDSQLQAIMIIKMRSHDTVCCLLKEISTRELRWHMKASDKQLFDFNYQTFKCERNLTRSKTKEHNYFKSYVCTLWYVISLKLLKMILLCSVGCDLNQWLQYLRYPVSKSTYIQGKNLFDLDASNHL